MSAYLLDAQTIGLLANYAVENDCTKYGTCYGIPKLDTAENVARILAQANLYSTAYRYPDIAANPAMFFQQQDSRFYTKECQHESRRAWQVPPIEILKSCNCYAYQASEPNDWHQSTAYKIISEIKEHAVRDLPGYDEAQWGYTSSNPPPIVRNMSELPDDYQPGNGEVISLFS